jgi:DNA-binding protein YbaB
MKGLKIDKSLVSDDISVVEDLIIAAHNDAKGKLEYETNAKMQELTAGLPLPPGLKFPF